VPKNGTSTDFGRTLKDISDGRLKLTKMGTSVEATIFLDQIFHFVRDLIHHHAPIHDPSQPTRYIIRSVMKAPRESENPNVEDRSLARSGG
jgi:hypothetical protein